MVRSILREKKDPQALNEMSGDLPSSLLITKNFVATSGEDKLEHLTRPKKVQSTRSWQSFSHAIGPYPSILPKQSAFSCSFFE